MMALAQPHCPSINNKIQMIAFGSNANGFLSQGDLIPRISPKLGIAPSSRLISVSCGSRTSFVVTANNQLYGCGSTVAGQLGTLSDDGDVTTLRRINVENVRMVATRGAHVLACDIHGYIFAWGRGDEGFTQAGKLGAPRLIGMPVKVKKVAVGKMHSVALDVFGQVWTWGMSGEGQTGLSTSKPVAEPTLLVMLDNRAVDISCGSRHTLVLSDSRKVYGFGANSYGQLGVSTTAPALSPKLIYDRQRVEGIACGYRHSCLWTDKHEVYGFGWNSHGQAVPSKSDTIVSEPSLVSCVGEGDGVLAIAGGGRHTLLVRRSSSIISIVGWGRGAAGELSAPIQEEIRIPRVILISRELSDSPLIACGWEHSVVASATAIKSYESASPAGGRSTPFVEYMSQRMGDVDAALAQLTNAVVLLKFLNPPGKAKAALLTTGCSNFAFSIWGYHKGATSLPHGLSTLSVFLFQTQVYLPLLATSGIEKATSACLFCTVSLGILELIASMGLAKYIGQKVPKAALLACMAGVGLVYISTNFSAQMFTNAHAGLAPFFIFIIGFAAREKMPFGLPVAFVALFVGWLLSNGNEEGLLTDVYSEDTVRPSVLDALKDSDNYGYLATVVIPLFIVTIVGNLACVEFAKASGDEYDESIALFLDASATILGAVVFGNCVPCCIYLGSVGFKAWGATFWYTLADSCIMFLLAFEYSPLVNLLSHIPRVAAIGMLVYIGLLVAGDAVRVKRHITAVIFGLVPAVASFHGPAAGVASDPYAVLGHGYMLVSMIFASTVSLAMDRKYSESVVWLILGAIITMLGLIHVGETENCVVGYLTCAAVCGLFAFAQWQRGELEEDSEPDQPYLASYKGSDSSDNGSASPVAPINCRPVTFRNNSLPPFDGSSKVKTDSPLTKSMSLNYGSV